MSKQKTLAVAIYDKMIENDHYTNWLNIVPVLVEEGHCKLQMIVRQEMLNGHGILHGGVAFALADSCFAFAANSYGRAAVTINANITFSKAAKEEDTLIAEAIALNVTYKTADFDVNIYEKASKEMYYRFRGTVYRTSKEFEV